MAGVAAFGSCGSLLYATNIETRWLDVTHTTIRLPKLQKPLRLLHLSDFHSSAQVPTPMLMAAARAAVDCKPDLICLTGDYITNFKRHDPEGLTAIFKLLLAAAPTYAVMGNHDGAPTDAEWNSTEIMRDLVASSGVPVLQNRSETLRLQNGSELVLAGTADFWNRNEFQPHLAFKNLDEELPIVVLSHNPDAKDAIASYPWDLMLSGHTHGGQVLLPFVDPNWLPVTDRRFIAGRYDWEGRQLFITRGVGSSGGIRFRCRPEVSVLHLEPAESI